MKLYPIKGGHGLVTAYKATIGSAEARKAGFVNQDGECLELEKVVDTEAHTILIRLAQKREE